MWIEPIFDRTQRDVRDKTSKGYLNIDDLNRIESNIDFLGNAIGVEVETVTWNRNMLPTKEQFDRILSDLRSIKESRTIVQTLDIPVQPINTYEKINTIEKILYDVYQNYIMWSDSIMRCGEGYAGNYDVL